MHQLDTFFGLALGLGFDPEHYASASCPEWLSIHIPAL